MATLQLDENLIVRMASNDGAAFRELYQQTVRGNAVYLLCGMKIKPDRIHSLPSLYHDAFLVPLPEQHAQRGQR